MKINPYFTYNSLPYKTLAPQSFKGDGHTTGAGKKRANAGNFENTEYKRRQMPEYDKLGFFTQDINTYRPEGKPEIAKNSFFIPMETYRKKRLWAKSITALTYQISDMITNDEDFLDILVTIESSVRKIKKNNHWGLRRTAGYNGDYFDLRDFGRGSEYWETYLGLFDLDSKHPKREFKPYSNEEYKDANTCTITHEDFPMHHIRVYYGYNGEKSNLKLVRKEYEKLKSIENPSLEQINKSVATMHWLIAQETPYDRGSDSIANVLTKAVYNAYGVKISQAKDEHGFDFEAFYRDLDDYIKIYPEIFKTPPEFSKE